MPNVIEFPTTLARAVKAAKSLVSRGEEVELAIWNASVEFKVHPGKIYDAMGLARP